MILFISIFLVLANITWGELPSANQTNKSIQQSLPGDLVKLCPLGDHTNVEVYDFIIEALKKSDSTRKEAIEKAKNEALAAQSGEIYKPYFVSVSERSLSHVISALCKADNRCVEVAVFDKSGLLNMLGLVNPEIIVKSASEMYTINDKIYNAFKSGKMKQPILLNIPASNVKGFTWNPLAKFVEITYPIFEDKHGMVVLSHFKDANKLIGFIRLLRLQSHGLPYIDSVL